MPNKEKSVRARWGETLSRMGFSTVPNFFLDKYHELGISTNEAMFIIHLARFKWTTAQPFPSLITISKKMGKDDSTVRGYAKSLHEKGYVIRNYRTGKTNAFNINPLIRALEDLYLSEKFGRESTKNWKKPSQNPSTKEEPLRKPPKNEFTNKSFKEARGSLINKFTMN